MQFYCDVCCSEFVWSEGRRVYCVGAKKNGTDQAAVAGAQLYAIFAAAVAGLVMFLIVLREVVMCRWK